ncbi:MAG: tRNA threonylcarbamoyladenosine dehydratase [Paludibacter sp.]|nr:tRNA threonylcarbamoyladenosine dehydratase [Paludibacter sp.]
MFSEKDIFQRTELLLGSAFMEKISAKKVILFGLGGVGSWCAESLIRAGIKHITIVDSDKVSVSNINRQLIATTQTVGSVKAEVLKERLLAINPKAEVTALQKIYDPESSDSFQLDNYDFIIDAIDSLSNKVHLIQSATKTKATFFSSMGAALKLDPTKIKVAEFWKVQGCPLGAALRSRIKKAGGVGKKFFCVYSDELLKNKGEAITIEKTNNVPGNNNLKDDNWSSTKARINGTISYMPAMFGMTLAGLVIQAIEKETREMSL